MNDFLENDEEKEKILMDIGLSKNEVKVYLSLLKLGSATAGEISSRSKVNRTNVYDALERLIKKGLASYIIKEKTKYFQANEPEVLMSLIKNKEDKLKQIISELSMMKRWSERKDIAHVMEGIQGVKAVTDDILKNVRDGGYVLTFGCPKDISFRMRGFLGRYHKIRISRRIMQVHIYNENAKERIKYLNSLPYTKADYLPKEYNSPATTTIYANKVSFWIWDKEPLVILVESKKMAEAYERYFWLLWSLTKRGRKEMKNKVK